MKPHLMERARKEQLDNCRFYNPMPKKELNKVVASADLGLMVLADVPAFTMELHLISFLIIYLQDWLA